MEETDFLTADYPVKLQSSKQYGTGTKTEIEKCNQIERPEINPNTYGHLIYGKGGKTIQQTENSHCNHWFWEVWTAKCEKVEAETFSKTIQKEVNSQRIKDLSVRLATIKLI